MNQRYHHSPIFPFHATVVSKQIHQSRYEMLVCTIQCTTRLLRFIGFHSIRLSLDKQFRFYRETGQISKAIVPDISVY